MRIGGQAFLLERGALFLISASGARPVIRQTALSKLNLEPGRPLMSGKGAVEYLCHLAKTDPDIRAFWRSATTEK